MTKYNGKRFSVALGSKEYRDNWDRAFAKPAPEPDLFARFPADVAIYRKDGMPDDVIERILKCRARADWKWAEGKKESAMQSHADADRIIDEWYAANKLPGFRKEHGR